MGVARTCQADMVFLSNRLEVAELPYSEFLSESAKPPGGLLSPFREFIAVVDAPGLDGLALRSSQDKVDAFYAADLGRGRGRSGRGGVGRTLPGGHLLPL